jgi:predicted MFS family arabinose efflux permease
LVETGGPAGYRAGMDRAPGRNLALALLTLIYVFNFMDRQIMGVLAEPIKRDLGLSDSQLGLLTGFMFALFYTTFGVPVAWLADRYGRVRVIAGSCALWSLFSAACGLAGSFATMAAARIGVAVGEAGGVPPSASLISDLFPPEKQARALALFGLGVPIGIGAGTAAAAWLADAFGWRVAFVAVSLPGLLLAGLLLALVREPRRTRPGAEVASLGEAVGGFVRNPALVAVSLAAALGAFTCYGLMAWIAAYLIRVLGMSLGEIGAWLSVTLAAGLGAGLWASGVLTDRFAGRDPRAYALLPAAGLLLGAPMLCTATLADDWRTALPLFGITLALSIFYLAPTLAAVQHLAPPGQRSTASALMLLCLNLIGLGGGPLLIGLASDWAAAAHGAASLRVAFQALVPVFVLASLASLGAARVLGRRRRAAAI